MAKILGHGQLQPCRTCFQKKLERSNHYARRYNASNQETLTDITNLGQERILKLNWQSMSETKEEKRH